MRYFFVMEDRRVLAGGMHLVDIRTYSLIHCCTHFKFSYVICVIRFYDTLFDFVWHISLNLIILDQEKSTRKPRRETS